MVFLYASSCKRISSRVMRFLTSTERTSTSQPTNSGICFIFKRVASADLDIIAERGSGCTVTNRIGTHWDIIHYTAVGTPS